MTLVFNTNIVSPHSVPLALGWFAFHQECRCTYLYHGEEGDRLRTESSRNEIRDFGLCLPYDSERSRAILAGADVLYDNVRDIDVFEERCRQGKKTFYSSERWFKPVRVDAPRRSERASGHGLCVSGFVKILIPKIFRRVSRMARIMKSSGGKFVYLPIGIHAARDMARLCGLFSGDLSCLFRAPKLEFERCAGGRIWAVNGKDEKYCTRSMRMWGYFVSGNGNGLAGGNICPSRLLWVGRILGCKRLDTIIRAVKGKPHLQLDIYGSGPDGDKVKALALGCENIKFHEPVDLATVRKLMREHDTYVFASNSIEGWGAVVNEAMCEGMAVVGSYESGACATLLPEVNVFQAGDWRALADKLDGPLARCDYAPWSVDAAASALEALTR